MRNDVNIRSPHFIVVRSAGTCWHCGRATALLALAVPAGHMVLELDDEAQDEDDAVDTWRIAGESALLFYVEYLSARVRRRLARFSQGYRLTAGEGAGSYWANHCEHCGSLLDDQDLYCESAGPFSPMDAPTAAHLELLPIDEALEAVVGGYAYDPCLPAL